MKKALFGYDIKEADAALDELTSRNYALGQRNDRLVSSLKEMQAQLEEAQQAAARAADVENTDSYRSLQEKLEEAEKKLAESAAESSRLKEAAEQANQQLNTAQEEARQAKEELERLKLEMADQAEEPVPQSEELEELRAAVSSLKEKNEERAGQLARLQVENDRLRSSAADAQDEISRLRQEREGSGSAEYQAVLRQMCIDVERSKQRVGDRMNGEIDSFAGNMENAENGFTQLIEELESTRAQAQSAFEADVQKLMERFRCLSEYCDRITAQMKTKAQDREAFTNEMRQIVDEMQSELMISKSASEEAPALTVVGKDIRSFRRA